MCEYLEHDGEQDEAQVRPANDLPREAIKEAYFIIDDRGWTSCGAESTSRVFHVWIAPQSVINQGLALFVLGVKVARSLIGIVLSEIDIALGVGRTVRTQEVHESDCTAHTCCGDERSLLARCVDCACVSIVNANLDVGEVEITVAIRRQRCALLHD